MKDLKSAYEYFNQMEWNIPLSAPLTERKRYLLDKTPDWEIILMVWGPYASTPIHDHNESKCWTRILKGQLFEKNIDRRSLEVTGSQLLNKNAGSYIEDDIGAHQLLNLSAELAVSLHFYARPIEFCHIYDEALGMWVINKVNYELLNTNEMHEKSIAT